MIWFDSYILDFKIFLGVLLSSAICLNFLQLWVAAQFYLRNVLSDISVHQQHTQKSSVQYAYWHLWVCLILSIFYCAYKNLGIVRGVKLGHRVELCPKSLPRSLIHYSLYDIHTLVYSILSSSKLRFQTQFRHLLIIADSFSVAQGYHFTTVPLLEFLRAVYGAQIYFTLK